MNKKFYLAALGVTMAFAACTEEELVNVPTATISLEDRGKVELAITADKSDFGATRMTAEAGTKPGEFTFMWEKDADKLGAAMADGVEMGVVASSSDKVFVTYPFAANSSGATASFSGKSSVAQGVYLFHYPYHDHLGRTPLSVSMPAQEYNAASETAAIDQALKYMKMVSPLVNLYNGNVAGVELEDAEAFQLPLTFENLYTIVKVKLTAKNIGENIVPEVKKVTFKATGFHSAATLDLDAMGTAAGFDAKKNFDATTFAAQSKVLHDAIYGGSIYATKEQSDVVLDVKGMTLENGCEDSLYVLLPKGNWSNVTMEILTSEGTYEKEIATLKIGETGIGNDAQKAALYAKRDNIQPIAANLDFMLDGSGNVKLPGNFDIYKNQDWTDAVKFVTDHAVAYLNGSVQFTLHDNVEITSLPTFGMDIYTKDDADFTLTLAGNYNVNEQNKSRFNAPHVTLNIKSGATLNLGAGITGFADIVNNGTVVVNASQTLDITNYGTIEVAKDATMAAITNGRVKVGDILAAAGTITVNKGVELTAQISNVNGTINLVAGTPGDTPDYTVWNVSVASANAADGVITINAAAQVAGEAITNAGTINHTGILAADIVNNNALNINSGAIGNGTVAISGTGKITIADIVDYGKVMNDVNKMYDITCATVTAVVNNYEQYASANDEDSKLTNITLAQGDWTFATSVADADKAKKMFVDPVNNITGVEYKGGTLTLAENLVANVEFSGASTVVCVKDNNNALVAHSITGNIKNTAALTISEKVTVNSNSSSNTYSADIDENVTVAPGAAMYFNTVDVKADKNLYVKGQVTNATTGAEITAAAIFGVKTTFTNNGYVEACAGQGKTPGYGEVSQPTNTSTGTFKGNATVINFI